MEEFHSQAVEREHKKNTDFCDQRSGWLYLCARSVMQQARCCVDAEARLKLLCIYIRGVQHPPAIRMDLRMLCKCLCANMVRSILLQS